MAEEEYERYESGLKAPEFNSEESYEAVVTGNKAGEENPDIIKDMIEGLQNVYDPEIPVDIYNLGLVYDISLNEKRESVILMTLTSPACPVAEDLPFDVANAVVNVKGLEKVAVKITWEVPWNMDMMTEEARLELNLF